MRKCRFCAKEIQDASRVCEHCGKDLVPGRVAEPAPAPEPVYVPEPYIPLDPTLSPAPIARVAVVDIDMPFSQMIVFMIKWGLAAVPALMILAALAFMAGLFLGAFSGGR